MTSHSYYREGEDRKGGARSNPSVKATMSKDPEITQEATSLGPLQVSQGILLSVSVPKSLGRLDQHPSPARPSAEQLPLARAAKPWGRAARCSCLARPQPPEAGPGQTAAPGNAEERPQFGVRKLRQVRGTGQLPEVPPEGE